MLYVEEENTMNDTTKELLTKIQKLMDEYGAEDIHADDLKEGIEKLIKAGAG